MDNVNNILGVSSEQQVPKTPNNNNSAEKTLSTIARILLVTGCLVGFVGFIGIFGVAFDRHSNPGEILQPISAFLFGVFSIVAWAILKVLGNISMTLKDIKEQLKNN